MSRRPSAFFLQQAWGVPCRKGGYSVARGCFLKPPKRDSILSNEGPCLSDPQVRPRLALDLHDRRLIRRGEFCKIAQTEIVMPDYVIETREVVGLPVANSEVLFPVRRVYCIGRNYGAHAIEMGHDPDREPPFFFQKNPDNLDPSGRFPYPPKSTDVHHEVEMAVALKSGGKDISIEDALSHVFGYALALDMTRRDLQGEAKRMGRPWEIGKAFERSAPIGPLHPVSEVGHPGSGRIALAVNGEIRQESDLSQMIWKVPEMISYLSEYFELAPGDVILSGTPAGVGPVARGDVLEASIDGLGSMSVSVV